jgi:hypothetical protein
LSFHVMAGWDIGSTYPFVARPDAGKRTKDARSSSTYNKAIMTVITVRPIILLPLWMITSCPPRPYQIRSFPVHQRPDGTCLFLVLCNAPWASSIHIAPPTTKGNPTTLALDLNIRWVLVSFCSCYSSLPGSIRVEGSAGWWTRPNTSSTLYMKSTYVHTYIHTYVRTIYPYDIPIQYTAGSSTKISLLSSRSTSDPQNKCPPEPLLAHSTSPRGRP